VQGKVWRALLYKKMATAFHEILATVRQTAAAHASALDELERAFSAQTVKNKSAEENCPHHHLKKKNDEFFFKSPSLSTTIDCAR
jgi:hypothetical protein